MTDSGETERFETQGVSSELVEAAGPWTYGEKKAEIERMLKRRAYGQDFVAAEVLDEYAFEQLESMRRALIPVKQQFHNLPSVIEELETFERELIHDVARNVYEREQQVRSEYEEEREETFEEQLAEIEGNLHDGMHIWPAHGDVEELAEIRGTEPAEIIELLKQRNPDVPEYAFKEARKADYRWTGFDSSDGLRSATGGRHQ